MRISHAPPLNRSATLADFSDPRILHGWKTEMQKAKQDYIKYWTGVIETPAEQQNRILIGNRLEELQDSQITRKPIDVIIKLFALKAIQKGQKSMGNFSEADLVTGKLNSTTAQLVQDIVMDLANLIHFEMKPHGSISFLDWNHLEGLGQAAHEFKFLVKMPPGAKNLQLRYYLRSLMWLKHILQALNAVIDTILLPQTSSKMNVQKHLKCSTGYSPDFDMLVLNALDNWNFVFIIERASLTEPISGWQVSLYPTSYNYISLVPQTVFQSRIEGYLRCYNQSLELCERQCVSSKAIAKCSCLPWNLANLLDNSDWPNGELCNEQCAYTEIVGECSEECSQRIEQSCKVIHTRVKGELDERFDWSLELLQQMDINISLPELYPHVKQFKEYELTKSSYLALLGGAIELWSAMDILGLTHLLVFALIGIYGIAFKDKQKEVTEVEPQRSMSLESIEQKYTKAIEKLNQDLWTKWEILINWLKGNEFYEATPFTGYGYINDARSVIEIVFWYGIIALFASLAAYNLQTNISDYISKTTKVNIVPKRLNSHLSNITLKMVLPILILTEYSPRIHYDIMKEQSENDLETITERLRKEPEINLGLLSQQLVDKWRNQSKQHFTPNKSNLSPNQGNRFYQPLIDSTTLLDHWIDRANNLSWSEIELPPSELFSGPRTEVDGLVFKLLLLRAIKTGERFLEQLGGEVNAEVAKTFQQAWSTTEQLYHEVAWQLGQVLHVRGARSRISDIDFDEQYLQKGTFALQVELTPPSSATSTHIQIDSLLHLWIQQLLSYQYSHHYLSIANQKFLLYFKTHSWDVEAYDTWFSGISYATLTAPSADMPILTSIYGNRLSNNMVQEFAMISAWTYHSEKNTCPAENEEMCIENCMVEQYLSLCNCVPWSVVEPNQHHLTCNKPCTGNNAECRKKCDNHFCDQQSHKFATNTFKHIKIFNASMFDFKISVIKNLHMHFLETYEHSLGTFLAQIGSVLEFWLGCNVIALLHCIAYLFRYIFNQSFRKKRLPLLKRLERRLKKVSRLDAQLHRDTKALLEAARKGTLGERNELRQTKHEHWLYKNRFYETTTITGFNFIAQARTRLEKLFWAALILIFVLITIFNVYTTIEYYSHKPTILATTVSTHSSQFELRNLTLRLNANLMELTQTFPTIVYLEGDRSSLPITDHFACELTKVEYSKYTFAEENIRFLTMYDLLNSGQWTLKKSEWPIPKQSQSSDQIFQSWIELFEKGSMALLEFWDRNKNSSLPETQAERNQLQFTLLMRLLDAPLRERNMSLNHGFFLLEALNTGRNPQRKLFKLLNAAIKTNWGPQPKDQTVDELLGDVSAHELVKRTEEELSKMILIRVIDEPDAEISLQGWSYESEDRIDFPNDLISQTLEYHIVLPQNRSRTQVQIVTYSFLRMWHNYIFNSLHEHFAKNNRLSEKFICKSVLDDIDGLIKEENEKFKILVMNPLLIKHNDLEIGTENLDLIIADEWKTSEILLHSTGAFHSNMNNCSTISRQHCLDQCRQRYSMSKCGCQPWGLLYLGESSPVCTAPCKPPAHCSQECESMVRHPCRFVHSRVQRTQHDLRDPMYYRNHLENAQHHVVIKTKVASYISHIESYETVGSFVAQLGSFLDLWLGINLLSIIHLMVFIAKLFLCKTKNSVRNSERSLLERIKFMEETIGKNIDLIRKETKLRIRRLRGKDARHEAVI